jgi:protein SCO1/2
VLLYFGFSRCPDICPSELLKVQKVLRLLGDEAPTPLFVSLDPRRDSLRQLRAYGKDFDERVRFLVGTPAQCKAAAKAYRVYSSIGPCGNQISGAPRPVTASAR